MIRLEVKNKPIAIGGQELTFHKIMCIAFAYHETTRELAIYETEKEWIDRTPAYTICYVTSITYFDDKEVLQ